MKPKIEIDSAALVAKFKLYREFSRRGLAEDINQKAYSIVNSAVYFTKRGSKANIRRYMRQASNVNPKAKVAPILVNWKRGKKGMIGLYGAEMKAEEEALIQRQADSINFLRAGWLSSLAVLAGAIGKAVGKNATRFLSRFGTGFGGAKKATRFSMVAYFWNQAFARNTTTNNGVPFARDGLQKAINQEVVRMGEYIARKQKERAIKAMSRP